MKNRLINNPLWPLAVMWRRLSPYIKNDRLYLKVLYYLEMRGAILNIDEPKLFTEKIQWLKLYAYKPEYSRMVDKAAVKDYVRGKIGEQYIIPTLAVWDNVDDIEWEKLPNQFVLKTIHGGGGQAVILCKDKSNFDKTAAIAKLKKWMPYNAGYAYREKPYINAKAGIIAESLMVNHDDNGHEIDDDLTDYKFYCFNGEPLFCQIIRGRNTKETIDFYDMNWNHMPFVGLNPYVKNGDTSVKKPLNFESMVYVARELSKDISFVRVDLYNIDGKVYFGEITFYPAGGIGQFNPIEWNLKLGELIKLNNQN